MSNKLSKISVTLATSSSWAKRGTSDYKNYTNKTRMTHNGPNGKKSLNLVTF